jgi:hypothetical protein
MLDEYCEQWLDLGNLEKHFEETDEASPQNSDKILKFDYFVLLFKSIFFWKKMRFQPIKEALYQRRREVYFGQTEPNMDAYKLLVKQEEALEAQCMQEVLDSILQKLGMPEEVFNKNVEHFSKDQDTLRQMKEITSITQESMLELKSKYLGEE